MTTPEYIKKDAHVQLRNGSEARIYATDGAALQGDSRIHGAIFTPPLGWVFAVWHPDGRRQSIGDNGEDIIDIWVPKPDASVVWPLLPPWIHWLAMDMTGEWFGYGLEPAQRLGAGSWASQASDAAFLVAIPEEYAPKYDGSWDKSLIRRLNKDATSN